MIEAFTRRVGVALLVAVLLRPTPAFGSERLPSTGGAVVNEHRLSWSPYRRFQPLEYALTFAAPVAFRFFDYHTTEAAAPRWRGPILLDSIARDVLQASGTRRQRLAARWSDYGWYSSMAWPLVDATVVALLLDQNPDVAWQLSALLLQAYAWSGAISLTMIRAFARERPLDSERDGAAERSPPRSFPSGHTAGAFAGAGLVCSSHAHLPLYASPLADGAACVAALSLATATAVLRVSSDRHYASDAIVGAGIGLTTGWVLPVVLHYTRLESRHGSVHISPSAAPGSFQLLLSGDF